MPQFLWPRLKHFPHRIGRLQKRKTPWLYIERVAHHPCASPLKVWTWDHCWIWFLSGRLYAFFIPSFVLNVPFSIFNFLIRLRPHHQVRHLVSHPLPSARSSPRSRPPFSKISKVRTSYMTPCGFVSGSICFEFIVSSFLFQLIFRIESCFVAPVCV